MNIKSAAEFGLRHSGLLDVIRWRRRQSLRILMYHRFPGDPQNVRERLSRQCAHLVRHYNPVSLSEVARAWRNGDPLPLNPLVITVDDGYRDFAVAFPAFREFGLKIVFYVASGFLDRECWLWPDRIAYLFEQTGLRSVSVPLPGQTLHLRLESPAERLQAVETLEEHLIASPDSVRLGILDELPRLLGVAAPRELPDRYAPVTWTELRTFASQGLEVGAHTRTHPILSRLQEHAQLESEIAGSQKTIESHLQAPVVHFCYPNGKKPDVSAEAVAIVKERGFETAVLTEPGVNPRTGDLFSLRRMGVDPTYPTAYFERWVAGYGTELRPGNPLNRDSPT